MIKNIGSYHVMDNEGFILNPCQYPVVQKEYQLIVNETIHAYLAHLPNEIDSTYIRGSVAKGNAIHHISDLDTIAISRNKIEISNEIRDAISESLVKKHPFVTGVEIVVLPWAQKFPNWVSFLLQTQCVCVFGNDLVPYLPKHKPGKDAIVHLPNIIIDIEETIHEFEKNELSEQDRLEWCAWIMKRIVRSGFELVKEQEQLYTRDLYPCYASFIKYYLEQETAMKMALTFAIQPMAEVTKINAALKFWKEFYQNEMK